MPRHEPSAARTLARLLLVLAAALLVYGLGVGVPGLEGTEGHRVAPAYAMLDSGDHLRVTMFDATYLRKPPGMPWAIALSSSVLGRSELSARLPSVLASAGSALVIFFFAVRWFGPRAGLPAALTFVLLPLTWAAGRAADIEALHNLGLTLAALALIDASRPGRHRAALSVPAAGIGLGLTVAVIAKGPAGLPTLLGVAVGIAAARRSPRPLLTLPLALGILAAVLVLAPLAVALHRHNADPDAIREDVSGFLWSLSALPGVALLPITAFIAALPASLALLFPWGPDARRESLLAGQGEPYLVARTLAYAWLASLAISMALGIHNPRYLMPASVILLPPLVGSIAAAWAGGVLTPSRVRVARVLCLGAPPVLATALLGAAMLTAARAAWWDPDRTGGPDAGAAIAHVASHDADIWADGLVEARPDVLLYATDLAAARGITLRPRWRKADVQAGRLPEPGDLLALRTDPPGDESPPYRDLMATGRLEQLARARVHDYAFTIYRVTNAAAVPK